MSSRGSSRISLAAMSTVGGGLRRPECVLCTAGGDLYVSDWDGGVCLIRANGEQQPFLASNAAVGLRPNGIALLEDGSFLLANLGDDGGVWHLRRDGVVEPFVIEVEGKPLPPSNFVLPDRDGRVWITVSTSLTPRAAAYRADVADGFVVVVDGQGARIAATGLGYANEVRVHPGGEWLYVNETFGRRLSRMKIHDNGELGAPETVTEFGEGTFPDGLCFDEEGGIWIVSIVSNRIIRLAPDGVQQLVVEDADREHLQAVESAFQSGTMGRPHLDKVVSRRLGNISSIAFGGPGRRTAYVGCLLGDHLVSFESPVAGVEPVHWRVP